MDDALLVGCVQRIEDLHAIFDGLLGGHRPARAVALDVLHDEVVGSDVVELADVRMVEGGDGARLALGALVVFGFGNLDRDDAVEACVARLVDLGHAALADCRQDFVGAQPGSGGERHILSDDFIR